MPNISRVLLGLGVVVAEQVQDAVHREQVDLVVVAVPGGGGLLRGDLRAQRDVAEVARVGLSSSSRPGRQLVHGERQDVGGALLAHPLLVEHGDRVGVDEPQRQLGGGVQAHAAHDEPAQPGQGDDVDVGARTH